MDTLQSRWESVERQLYARNDQESLKAAFYLGVCEVLDMIKSCPNMQEFELNLNTLMDECDAYCRQIERS